MIKIINFGKVDYLNHGRKDCSVNVILELKTTDKGPGFSASGEIWNEKHTDIYEGGQCLETIKEFIHNDKFNKIFRLWELYHLNTMNAGDTEQEKAVEEYLKTNVYDYTEVCKYLDSIGLLVHNGYKYGTAWIYSSIPEEDLKLINELME